MHECIGLEKRLAQIGSSSFYSAVRLYTSSRSFRSLDRDAPILSNGDGSPERIFYGKEHL